MKTTALLIFILVLITAASIVLANQTEPISLPVQYQNTPFSPEYPDAPPTRTPAPTRTIPQYPTPAVLVVRVTSVNIHAGPEYSAQVTGWLHQGDRVILEVCAGPWVKLQGSGYVMGTCFVNNPCGDQGSCQ